MVKTVPGSLDKKEGRSFHLILRKNLHLIPPLLSDEPGTGNEGSGFHCCNKENGQVSTIDFS
jgi:hypothetical protein